MIHLFETMGSRFAYDVYSGALHMPDKLAYDILGLIQEGKSYKEIEETLADEHARDDIKQTISEIESLKESGLLFTEFDYDDVKPLRSDRIKAMCLHIAHDCNLRCQILLCKQRSIRGKALAYELRGGQARARLSG